jgi:hypothetical protein
MNQYTITLEMDERTYRRLKKAEIKLRFKDSSKCMFIPFSKRQIKYKVGGYLTTKRIT